MSKLFSGLPLEIDAVDRTNLLPSLGLVRGCLKTTSMLWMHALGLKVLSGIIVSNWSVSSARAVQRFAKRAGLSEFLLRIDKRHERWTRRRGGYLLKLAEVPRTVRELQREGMISLLLEPASPYKDQYGLAGVTVPDQSKLIVEVVGPGFDASDILRNDLQPHERWEANLGTISVLGKNAVPMTCRRTYMIAADQYSASVERRLGKIGARLADPAFPESVRETSSEVLRQRATDFLKKTRQTKLLKHAQNYSAISEKHIDAFAREVQRALFGLSAYGIHLGPSSFSASVIAKRGLIFWDFFPARKQEAASLYPGD